MTLRAHSDTPPPWRFTSDITTLCEHLESVPVVETFRGETVWEGTVEVFGVANPPPDRAYGWAVESDYVAVLGNPPVDSPIVAVRAWLASEAKKGKP